MTGITSPNSAQPLSDERLREFLRSAHTIAVVGLSSSRMRASHGVAKYLQSAGYRIFPVNPNETEVLGEKAYARLEDLPEKIDIVDVFRRSEFVSDIVDSAIRIGARAVWMQDGVRDDQAAARARQAGLLVVMDDCLLREHWRLLHG
jgi:hypothetical protein